MVTSGLPGCWAERYGSRAPEWRTKVSTNTKGPFRGFFILGITRNLVLNRQHQSYYQRLV
jgi:hypothetical protein